MYVLDASVILALRRPELDQAPTAWARCVPEEDLYVTAFTIAEIERGADHRAATDPGEAEVLRRWFLGHVLPAFRNRVLAFDLGAARAFARFAVPEAASAGHALTGAVAQSNGMIVSTRDTEHYSPLGVRTVSPWEWYGE